MKQVSKSTTREKWCPFIQAYIMGGEPYCSLTGMEYPHVKHFPCDAKWETCSVAKKEEVKQ